MKKRTFFAAALLAIIGVVVLLWLKAHRASPPLESAEPAISEAAKSAAQSPTASPVRQTPLTVQPDAKKLLPDEQRREAITAWEQAREKEVEFWGKVIDQHNDPVAGVVVTATITTHQIPPPGFKPQPTAIYSANTDASGVFYIKGRSGRGFTIETMKKEGYLLPPALQNRTDNLFLYNYDQLDPKGFKAESTSPVIFHMWKIEQPEKLIKGEGFYGIIPDGVFYTVDLLTQKHARGETMGDFRVKIDRPQNVKWGARGYEWSCEIEGVGGGVIETQDEFMYRAPENGYLPRYNVKISANDEHWSDQAKRQFYLKSREGKIYARLEVEVLANYQDKAVFSVKYYANQNGSRNLEYAPAQAVLQESRLKAPTSAPTSKP
jgi:hypothetical protein